MLWILLLVCCQFRGDYWIRHIRPDFTSDFAKGIDEDIMSLFKTCAGMNMNDWSDFALERIRLPIKENGCGLRQAEDRRHGQYIGALAQSVLPLLDSKDANNNTTTGRLNIPCLIAHFGDGSFDRPLESPWGTLLTSSNNTSSNIACGLQHAWSQLTSSFQEAAEPQQLHDENCLLNQDTPNAGFYKDGSIAKSVTKAITNELEKARSDKLSKSIAESLNKDNYERWSHTACDRTSSVFLHSPPDQYGYMEDEVFQVALATYLGQPCPIMAPLVGRYFGKKGKQLDKYGANLAAAPLPGQGHSALHNHLQSLIMAMMKLGGISSDKEAANFLIDKIGEPYITNYVNHLSDGLNSRNTLHNIIPDIVARNYPTGSQRINDSGATSSAEAMFEIKTMSPCPSRYSYSTSTTTPADRKAKWVVSDYDKRFKKLDVLFASDVVGDGRGGIVGPFEAAQRRFYRGQVIPLIFGAFGDINEDADKIIRRLAREAASGDDGMTISPLVNTDRKGGAYPIMLQQFRRIVGVGIVRGQAKHKLARLHYVRETAAEAAAVCKSHHSDNRWKPSQNGRASWYSQHVPEGYGTFEQFRNGYDFRVP